MGEYEKRRMSEKISVIVPIYDVEKYLSQCIESIMEQTYKNLEIILVDDESPDRCPQICDYYAAKDSRIKVVHKKNGGVAEARNTGIDAATAKYIGFVDADDFIHPLMYEKLVEILEQTNSDISYCNLRRVYENDDRHMVLDQYTYNGSIKVYNNIESLYNFFNDLGLQTVVSWGKVYRKSIFDGVRYPRGEVNEDEFITYKLFCKSTKIVYINEMFYFYRIRTGSTMQTFTLKRLQVLDALKERTDFFKNKELDNLYIKSKTNYLLSIINHYIMAKEAKMDVKILKELKNRFRLESKPLNIIREAAFGKPRLGILLFYISPNLYKFLFKLYRNFKSKKYT